MNRMLRLTAVTGCALVAAIAGCQQNNAQMSNPGALPRHNPPEDMKINATTLFAHAHLLERQGAFERAVVQYEKALAEKPDFLTARNRLGITLNKLGRHYEASQEFEICIQAQPSLAYLHNNLGFSRYLEGQFELAEVHLRQALELDPEFSRARMNRAVVLSKLGRQQDAYQELVAIGTKADACFNMGILLTEAGEYDSAAQYLEAALASNPKFEAARKQLHEVARLAAEHEARVATEVYARQNTETTPPVATARPLNDTPRPSNPTPVEIDEVPLAPVATATPQPQPQPVQRSQPTVAQGSTGSSVYDNAPTPRAASSTPASTGTPVAQAPTSGVRIDSVPARSNSTRSPAPVVASAPQPTPAPAVASKDPQPASGASELQDPMSVSDTNGRVARNPQPSPSGSIETIYVGSTPIPTAHNTPAATPVAQGGTRPGQQGTGVVVEPVASGQPVSAQPAFTRADQPASGQWTADPIANVSEDECDDDYTIIETIDLNQPQPQQKQQPQPQSPASVKASPRPVTPVADETPLPVAIQPQASSAVIIEPVAGSN